jgi:3-hydroxy-9,10-secoandrosta-1,3,5(10)-triene-9,17-dione monooxygenase reductase component
MGHVVLADRRLAATSWRHRRRGTVLSTRAGGRLYERLFFGDPVGMIDARQFRNTLGMFATGVAVVVARAGEEAWGMTVNAVSSLSLDPMLVLFCPGKHTRFARHLGEITGFTINVLREDQEALSTYFAGGWRQPEPPPYRFVPSHCGLRLEGSLASIDCEMERSTEIGDHWLVVGRVVDVRIGIPPHRPLLFFAGEYHHIDRKVHVPAPDLTDVHDEPAHIYYEG